MFASYNVCWKWTVVSERPTLLRQSFTFDSNFSFFNQSASTVEAPCFWPTIKNSILTICYIICPKLQVFDSHLPTPEIYDQLMSIKQKRKLWTPICVRWNNMSMQGTRGGKLSVWATVCSLFATIQGKTVKGRTALRLYNSCHCPCVRQHIGLQVLQNNGSWMFILRVKTLSVQDCHCQNQEEEK